MSETTAYKGRIFGKNVLEFDDVVEENHTA